MIEVDHASGLFGLDLPEGWRWVPDEEGGAAVAPGAPGALVIAAHPVLDPGQLPTLQRMLAGFLTLRGRPVATDALIQVPVEGGEAYQWDYVEQEPGRPAHWWRLWVVGNPVVWALLSYNCPLDYRDSHLEELGEIVSSLRLAVEEHEEEQGPAGFLPPGPNQTG